MMRGIPRKRLRSSGVRGATRPREASASRGRVVSAGRCSAALSPASSIALATARLPAFLGGAAAFRARHASAAAISLPTARAAGLVPAARLLVHGRPRAALGLVLSGPASFVALLDVLLHPLLLVGVFVLFTTRHLTPP